MVDERPVVVPAVIWSCSSPGAASADPAVFRKEHALAALSSALVLGTREDSGIRRRVRLATLRRWRPSSVVPASRVYYFSFQNDVLTRSTTRTLIAEVLDGCPFSSPGSPPACPSAYLRKCWQWLPYFPSRPFPSRAPGCILLSGRINHTGRGIIRRPVLTRRLIAGGRPPCAHSSFAQLFSMLALDCHTSQNLRQPLRLFALHLPQLHAVSSVLCVGHQIPFVAPINPENTVSVVPDGASVGVGPVRRYYFCHQAAKSVLAPLRVRRNKALLAHICFLVAVLVPLHQTSSPESFPSGDSSDNEQNEQVCDASRCESRYAVRTRLGVLNVNLAHPLSQIARTPHPVGSVPEQNRRLFGRPCRPAR